MQTLQTGIPQAGIDKMSVGAEWDGIGLGGSRLKHCTSLEGLPEQIRRNSGGLNNSTLPSHRSGGLRVSNPGVGKAGCF